MSFGNVLLIGIHAVIAWILIETFVNTAHHLQRRVYIMLHYLVVIAAFFLVFTVYYAFFESNVSPFAVTVVGMGFVLLSELVVFRYLYTGERWFLNWVDWIFPIFLAASAIYAVGVLR